MSKRERTLLVERCVARYQGDPASCWPWIGSMRRDGYGHAWYQGKLRLAHRAIYMMLRGEPPAGMGLDHLCRNRACVNPAHLEPVPQIVNVRRGNAPMVRASLANVCAKGHPLTPENTRVNVYRGRVVRACRACIRAREHRERTPATHCKYGHEFLPENTAIRKQDGARICRTCARARQRAYQSARHG